MNVMRQEFLTNWDFARHTTMSMRKLSKKSYMMITIIYDDRIDGVAILPYFQLLYEILPAIDDTVLD
jgi:hypothetical protein